MAAISAIFAVAGLELLLKTEGLHLPDQPPEGILRTVAADLYSVINDAKPYDDRVLPWEDYSISAGRLSNRPDESYARTKKHLENNGEKLENAMPA